MKKHIAGTVALCCTFCCVLVDKDTDSYSATQAEKVLCENNADLSKMAALDFLDSLVDAAASMEDFPSYVRVRPVNQYVKVTDIEKLIGRLHSVRPCLGVVREDCGKRFGLTSEGRQAAYLVASFRHNIFPSTCSSNEFILNERDLEAWWMLRNADGLNCETNMCSRLSYSQEERMAEEKRILGSVFAYMLNGISFGDGEPYESCFLALESTAGQMQDPAPEILSMFKHNMPYVKAFSEMCDPLVEGLNETKEKSSMACSPLLVVENIEWKSEEYVEVNTYTYISSLNATGDTLCLKRYAENWVVAASKSSWLARLPDSATSRSSGAMEEQ